MMTQASQGVNPGSTRPVNAIFQREWWLDAVAPGAWRPLEVYKGDRLVAWMPIVERAGPFGLALSTMPGLTQTLGPWLAPSEASYVKALGQQHEHLAALIEQIPAVDMFAQTLHFSVTNTLPFHWAGFATQVNQTYVLPDLHDLDAIWRGMHERTRRNIRKARKRVTVAETDDVEAFLRLNDLTFARQGRAAPHSHALVRRIDAAASARSQRKIWLAQDEQGRLHAGLYLVFDEHAAYYLMGGADPELRNSEAGSLLMWTAIQFAAGVSGRFDFEGSMMRRVEPYFRSFGARQTPYYGVRRATEKGRIAHAGRAASRALKAQLKGLITRR